MLIHDYDETEEVEPSLLVHKGIGYSILSDSIADKHMLMHFSVAIENISNLLANREAGTQEDSLLFQLIYRSIVDDFVKKTKYSYLRILGIEPNNIRVLKKVSKNIALSIYFTGNLNIGINDAYSRIDQYILFIEECPLQ